MPSPYNQPIGVFDSGLGGLTVVKAIMRRLPKEHIIYFGDTARVPYGTKSKKSIIQFSVENGQVLLKHKVKCIVVACNSSSSYALPELRRKFDVPILGVIEPGARKAVEVTRNERIGVIATSATINSFRYQKAIERLNQRAKVLNQPCPLFVPIVEEGWMNKPLAQHVADEYLRPLKKGSVDTLILGCTHYPLLKRTIQKAVGKKVALVDSAQEVAIQVERLLEERSLRRKSKVKRKCKFLVSDKPQEFARIARQFMGQEIKIIRS